MTTILLTILVGVVSAFSKSIFDRIFREYNPDTKKLISNIKNFLLFIVRYVLPIIFLIYFFINGEFNKSFVLVISILVTTLIISAIVDVFGIIQKKTLGLIASLVKSQTGQVDILSEIQQIVLNELSSDKTSKSNETENNL